MSFRGLTIRRGGNYSNITIGIGIGISISIGMEIYALHMS